MELRVSDMWLCGVLAALQLPFKTWNSPNPSISSDVSDLQLCHTDQESSSQNFLQSRYCAGMAAGMLDNPHYIICMVCWVGSLFSPLTMT